MGRFLAFEGSQTIQNTVKLKEGNVTVGYLDYEYSFDGKYDGSVFEDFYTSFQKNARDLFLEQTPKKELTKEHKTHILNQLTILVSQEETNKNHGYSADGKIGVNLKFIDTKGNVSSRFCGDFQIKKNKPNIGDVSTDIGTDAVSGKW